LEGLDVFLVGIGDIDVSSSRQINVYIPSKLSDRTFAVEDSVHVRGNAEGALNAASELFTLGLLAYA
jgi:hypothetical protein